MCSGKCHVHLFFLFLFVVHCTPFWRRWWHPTPVLLPGKSHGWRSLVGCSLWGHEESDTTERLHFHFSLSCIGRGNGNPLQCSCQENPRDSGAWWAAVYGVPQSQTRRKRLSSSSITAMKSKSNKPFQFGVTVASSLPYLHSIFFSTLLLLICENCSVVSDSLQPHGL